MEKFPGLESFGDPNLPELVPKPNPVLLENMGSKTDSERHDQTVLLSLTINLNITFFKSKLVSLVN